MIETNRFTIGSCMDIVLGIFFPANKTRGEAANQIRDDAKQVKIVKVL